MPLASVSWDYLTTRLTSSLNLGAYLTLYLIFCYNADVFIGRLEHAGLLVLNLLIEELRHHGAGEAMPEHTVQGRFVRAVGLSRRKLQMIERGRHAAHLLCEGTTIADVVVGAAYFDQPQLTQSLRQLIGHTPAEVARGGVFLGL